MRKRHVRIHICKNARLPGHECKCVICDRCLDRARFGNAGTTRGQGGGRRKGKEEKAKKDHKPDVNGCTHNDLDTFQSESSPLYYSKKWREDNPDRCLDENCLMCQIDMFTGQYIDLWSMIQSGWWFWNWIMWWCFLLNYCVWNICWTIASETFVVRAVPGGRYDVLKVHLLTKIGSPYVRVGSGKLYYLHLKSTVGIGR